MRVSRWPLLVVICPLEVGGGEGEVQQETARNLPRELACVAKFESCLDAAQVITTIHQTDRHGSGYAGIGR